MKKSEIYRVAQVAVMQYPLMNSTEKLAVLRELMEKEDVEKYMENMEATKGDVK
jgi:hypothetical protein